MKPLKVLLIGSDPGLLQPIPSLLTRAGFTVDVISQTPLLRATNQINNLWFARDNEHLLELVASHAPEPYDLIVLSEDVTISLILKSSLPSKLKLKLLPVTAEKYYPHLFSKIGLSKALEAGNVLTPSFAIAQHLQELSPLANSLGYPVMIKINASSGGIGVFICKSDRDIDHLLHTQEERLSSNLPLLIQKKIEGITLDLSAFYQNGELIYFSHAAEEKTMYPLGPSCVRTYTQLGALDKSIYEELAGLGKALGAHGFSNITAIWSCEDHRRYIIEADLRPNVWADYSRYIGNDTALAIQDYFEHGTILQFPQPINEQFPSTLLVPLVSRLKFWEIVLNQYDVWQFATREQIVRRLIGRPVEKIRYAANRYAKPLIPAILWLSLANGFAHIKIKLVRLLGR